MQEQKTNLEKIINSSIEEIRQKMMTICENGYKKELDFQSAKYFISFLQIFSINNLSCVPRIFE